MDRYLEPEEGCQFCGNYSHNLGIGLDGKLRCNDPDYCFWNRVENGELPAPESQN